MAELIQNSYTLQHELANALQSVGRSIHYPECDLIVSHCEINAQHGVGVLLQRLFPDSTGLVTIRSQDLYGGQQDFGDRHFCVGGGNSFAPIAKEIQGQLGGITPRHLLSIPYFPEDYQVSIAIKRLYNCPLCVFIMDDQNIYAPNVPDSLVRELLERADLCLGISRPLCDAYEAKFNQKFWFVPPVVEGHLIQTNLPSVHERSQAFPQGVLIGNIWSQQWLDKLRPLCKAAGVKVDWYGNPNRNWINFEEISLAQDGISFKGFIPEEELIQQLRQADFAIIPTGSSEDPGDRPELTKLSLPSRSCFITATANLPILVVGDGSSAIAKFVESQGLGVVSAYDAGDFSEKIDYLLEHQWQIRQQSLKVGLNLNADGVAQWIWDSLPRVKLLIAALNASNDQQKSPMLP